MGEIDAGWAVVVGVVSGVLGALGTFIATIIQARHKAQMDRQAARSAEDSRREATALDQWKELHRLQQEQLDRAERHIESQDALIDELYQADAECQVTLTQIYGAMERLHDTLGRCCASLRRHGEEVEPMFPLPPRPERKARRAGQLRTEVVVRQAAQDSRTLAAVTEELKAKGTPGGGQQT